MPTDPPYTYGTLARKGGDPQDASKMAFLKGKGALEREEYKLAEVNFAQALHLSPNNAQAMIFLLYAQLKRRPTLREVGGLQQALKLAPNDPLTLRTAAKVEVILDHAPKAMALLEKARSIDSNDPETHAELAAGYLTLRKRTECEAAFKEALRLAPENELALSVKASFAKVYFDAASAQRAAEQTLRKSTDTAGSHTFDGKAAFARNEIALGYWHLREALRLDPHSREAHEALDAALKQRFPLYDRFYRFSQHAIRWRVVSSFVLVYAVARLIVLATSEAAMPLWARPALLAAVAVIVGLTALLLWPMPIVNFALRFHPVGRYTLTKTDRAEDWVIAITLLSGVASLIAWPAVHSPALVMAGLADLSIFLGVASSASVIRSRPFRGMVLGMSILLWLLLNGVAALIISGGTR